MWPYQNRFDKHYTRRGSRNQRNTFAPFQAPPLYEQEEDFDFDTMPKRNDDACLHDEDRDAREVLRGMVAGQEQVANILQQLSTNVQNLTVPRRPNIDQDQEGSIHGEHHRYIAPARTFERATRPTLVRNDAEEEEVEESGERNFADNILAMHDEWDAMPPRVKDHLNFDRFMSQKR